MSTEPEKAVEVGQVFGKLTVTEVDLPGDGRGPKAEVKCECGVVKTYHHWQLRNGLANSCGCRRGNPTITAAFGESKNLLNWSKDERCRVKYVTLVQRLSRGWEPESAISTPVVVKPDSNRYRKNWSPRRRTDEQKLQADLEYIEKVMSKKASKNNGQS